MAPPPPPGVSTTPEALRPPSSSPTPGDSWATPKALQPPLSPGTPEVSPPVFTAGLRFFLLAPASPHGGPALPPCWRLRRWLSRCCSNRPSFPPVLLPRRFLVCPMTTLSACFRSPLAPPRLYCPPPSLTPLNPPRSRRSIPHSRHRSPRVSPSRGTPPCLRRCLPDLLGPVSCAPYPPSSSPMRSLSSSPSPPRHADVLLLPHSILPLRLFYPLPPAGPCGRSPRPSRPFPQLRPLILPVGTNMLAIRREGLLRLGWWRAGLRLARISTVGPAP